MRTPAMDQRAEGLRRQGFGMEVDAPSCWQATHVPLMQEARVAASGAERM